MNTEQAVKDKRIDVFVSFHGSERLLCSPDGNGCDCKNGCHTVRDLVKRMVDKKDNILQHHWVNGTTKRCGTLGIFFDDEELKHSPDGLIKKGITNGLLQTRGGGVVAILATPGYFASKWCMFELSVAWKLAAQEEVRLCFISVGISVEEASERTAFLHENKEICRDKFQILPLDISKGGCLCCNVEARKEAASMISSMIVHRGDGIVAGASFQESLDALAGETEEMLRETRGLTRLMGHLQVDNKDQLLIAMNKMSRENSNGFLDSMHKFFNSQRETSVLKDCKMKLNSLESKWCRSIEWDHPRGELEELFTAASMNALENTTQHRRKQKGFNKSHRDVTKLLLVGTSLMLLVGCNGMAIFLSALAIAVVKRGKMRSVKNLKWIALAFLSFLAGIFACIFMSVYKFVNGERAYELWLAGRFIDSVWGSILALFLASAFWGKHLVLFLASALTANRPSNTTSQMLSISGAKNTGRSSSQDNNFQKSR